MEDNNDANNNLDEPCDDLEDEPSGFLITENPYSLFNAPSPTLTLPPPPTLPPPLTTQNPGPTNLTEQADNRASNDFNDVDFSFLDDFPPVMFEPDFLTDADFMMNEEINVGGQGAGGDSGAGPSGTKELAFQYIKRSVLNCYECQDACDVYDRSNGLYNMGFQVHKVADQFVHLIFDVHPSDPEVDTGIDTYYLDFGGYELDRVNQDVAKYAIYFDQNGWMHVLDSFFNVYNKILEGLMNKDQLFSDINNINDNRNIVVNNDNRNIVVNNNNSNIPVNNDNRNIVVNNNNSGNLQINNQQINDQQQQNNPPLSPQFDDEAGGQDDDQLLDELDLENLNDVNIVEQVYPWMVERADSGGSSSDSEDNPEARPSIGVQRERTAQWTLLDLAPYFHLKAEKASKRLKVCPTTLKIVCRKLHLRRWPYRKISSIDNKLSGLKRSLREKVQQGDMRGVLSLKEEIEKEKQKRVRLYLFLTRDR